MRYLILAFLLSGCGAPPAPERSANPPACDLLRSEEGADVYVCFSPNCALQYPNERASILYMQAVADPSPTTPKGVILKQCCDSGNGVCS